MITPKRKLDIICVISGVVLSAFILIILLPALVQPAYAQQEAPGGETGPVVASAPSPAPSNVESDERYRIGPGDVLDVRVFNRPMLSREAVRVDGRGMIQMPLIEGDIKAACLTESELAKEIAIRYLKYQRNPHVDVFVKEFNSQPVAVIGAVGKPGQFQLQRRVRLLELLAFAGGPSEKAGSRIQIVRASGVAPLCNAFPAAVPLSDGAANLISSISLNDTLRGQESANPFVQPGDIITLPEAEMAYVIGNVLNPSPIPLKEAITISRAIAMVGGTLPDTKSDRVRVTRQIHGSLSKTEILIDLKAINRHQAEDIVLESGDIIEVPTSSGKRLLRSLIGTIVPSMSQLPIQVIR